MKSNLYWITDLTGAGKTTIGTLFYSYLQEIKNNVIYLDGDTLREVFCDTQQYSPYERKILALRYSQLCKMWNAADKDVDILWSDLKIYSSKYKISPLK